MSKRIRDLRVKANQNTQDKLHHQNTAFLSALSHIRVLSSEVIWKKSEHGDDMKAIEGCNIVAATPTGTKKGSRFAIIDLETDECLTSVSRKEVNTFLRSCYRNEKESQATKEFEILYDTTFRQEFRKLLVEDEQRRPKQLSFL